MGKNIDLILKDIENALSHNKRKAFKISTEKCRDDRTKIF